MGLFPGSVMPRVGLAIQILAGLIQEGFALVNELTLWGPVDTLNSGIDVDNLRACVLRRGGCSSGWPSSSLSC